MKEIWQKIHTHYVGRDWFNKPSVFAEQVITYFPHTGVVLELGGALGQDSAFFKQQGYDVLLTDFSEEVLRADVQKHALATKVVDLEQICA